MEEKNKQRYAAAFHVRRLTLNAVLAALYVVFATLLSFKTPFFEVSLVSVPIFLSAALFGADAIFVALLGSLIEQLLSPYGLSVTTPLWMAPPVLLAAVAALGFLLLRHQRENASAVLLLLLFCEVLLTVSNTAALYLDGYIMGYAVKALHLIALPRAINGGVRALLSCLLLPLLLPPLRRFARR